MTTRYVKLSSMTYSFAHAYSNFYTHSHTYTHAYITHIYILRSLLLIAKPGKIWSNQSVTLSLLSNFVCLLFFICRMQHMLTVMIIREYNSILSWINDAYEPVCVCVCVYLYVKSFRVLDQCTSFSASFLLSLMHY